MTGIYPSGGAYPRQTTNASMLEFLDDGGFDITTDVKKRDSCAVRRQTSLPRNIFAINVPFSSKTCVVIFSAWII
jgi:hypothetical protein